MAKRKIVRKIEVGIPVGEKLYMGDSVICKGKTYANPDGGHEYEGRNFKGKVVQIKEGKRYPYGVALGGKDTPNWWANSIDLKKF